MSERDYETLGLSFYKSELEDPFYLLQGEHFPDYYGHNFSGLIIEEGEEGIERRTWDYDPDKHKIEIKGQPFIYEGEDWAGIRMGDAWKKTRDIYNNSMDDETLGFLIRKVLTRGPNGVLLGESEGYNLESPEHPGLFTFSRREVEGGGGPDSWSEEQRERKVVMMLPAQPLKVQEKEKTFFEKILG